jgi:5'-nucleotidase
MRSLNRGTFLSLLCGSLVLLAIPSWLPAAAPVGRTTHLTILQINDVYEIGPVEYGKRGGLARMATLRDRMAGESPYTIFVLPGDFLSPSTMSSKFQGSQMVATLNAAGLDLATFGNHEFDFGVEVARERMRDSGFTWVSANVLDPATGLPFGGALPFVLREYGGVWVAFFGLVTPETRMLSRGDTGLTFLDPIRAAKDVVGAPAAPRWT